MANIWTAILVTMSISEYVTFTGPIHSTHNISMSESKTVVSTYTLYRHLQQYCSHPSICIENTGGVSLKVALQILGRNFNQNTKKSSLYSQSFQIFIQRTPVVERHPITRESRYLLWPRSTLSGNTVYSYMSSTFMYNLKIHRRSFKHSFR